MLFVVLAHFLTFSIAQEVSKSLTAKDISHECLSMPNFATFIPIKDGETLSEQNLYSCNQIFKKPLSVTKGLLCISHCHFTLFQSTCAIRVSTDGLADTGTVDIDNCYFYRNEMGCISIASTSESQLFNINECTFTFCKINSGGAAIDFRAIYGHVKSCSFINNRGANNKIPDIYYDSGVSSTNKLKIESCLFELRIGSTVSTNCYVSFTSVSKLDFINNEINVPENKNTKIFNWPSDVTSADGFDIRGNIVYPHELLFENVKDIIPDGFTLRPIMDCPKPPEGSGIDPNNFICEGTFGDHTNYNKGVGPGMTSKSLVGVYYSTFSQLKNTASEKGGGIYVFTQEIPSEITSPVILSHNNFYSCEAKEGHAIYLETTGSSRLYDISECHFYSNYDTSSKMTDIKGSVFIKAKSGSFLFTKCFFASNICDYGGGIYYESDSKVSSSRNLLEEEAETNYALFISNCTFYQNSGDTHGGGVYIKLTNAELSKPIEICSCVFHGNTANDQDSNDPEVYDTEENGGAIYYEYNSASSLDTNQEISFTFRVTDSIFNQNSASSRGAGIYILITNIEPAKPIEINHCFFDGNKARYSRDFVTDYSYGSGSCIFYDFNSALTSTAATGSHSLYVSNCDFSNNLALVDGGSISILIQNGEPSKPIEITQCTFTSNTAKCDKEFEGAPEDLGSGGDIMYTYKSSSVLSIDPNSNPSLNINNCVFTNSNAYIKAGSLYFYIQSGEPKRSIELSTNVFQNCASPNKDAIYIQSSSSLTPFHITDCEFQKYAISFLCPYGTIEKCRFINVAQFALNYDCSLNFIKTASLVIKECNFTQEENQIDSLIYFTTKLASKFEFIGNNVSVPTGKAYALGSKDPFEGDDVLKEKWNFEKNVIDPPKKTYIKTKTAAGIPVGCFIGFECEEVCPNGKRCDINGDDDDEKILYITDYAFGNDLVGPHDGAAIHLINYALYCKDSTFTGCKAQGFGGGGIYIKLDQVINENVYLEGLTFNQCEAQYGGGVYIYSNKQKNKIQIYKCNFYGNVANHEPLENGDPRHFDGSGCFLQVYEAVMIKCRFKSNIGNSVKLISEYGEDVPSSARSLMSADSSIKISQCIFETEKKSSSSSIFLIRSNKIDVPIEINDCEFVGDLQKGSHYIDGSFTNKEDLNLRIRSCKFSSDNKSAFKLLLDSDEKFIKEFNQMNSFENNFQNRQKAENKISNFGLMAVLAVVAVCVCAALIGAFIIIIFKRNSHVDADSNDNNQAEL